MMGIPAKKQAIPEAGGRRNPRSIDFRPIPNEHGRRQQKYPSDRRASLARRAFNG